MPAAARSAAAAAAMDFICIGGNAYPHLKTMLKYPTPRMVDVSAASQIRARLAFRAICEMMLPS